MTFLNIVAWLTLRLLLFPFFCAAALLGTFAHLVIWLVDPHYDHKAAKDVFTAWADWWKLR